MEKKIYIGLFIVLALLLVLSLFGKKRDKVIAKIKDFMVLARIWLHTEEGEAKKKWVIDMARGWIASHNKLPITTKILLFIFTEDNIGKIIDKLAPDVKETYKPVIQHTLNKVGEVAVETVAKKIIDLGIEKSQDITKVAEMNTKEVIDLANVLKFTDKDKGVVSAIASYKTNFEDEKEFIGSIGFAKKL
jgi:hypothetical protein